MRSQLAERDNRGVHDRGACAPMDFHLAKLPKLIAERRSSAILGVFVIALLWAGVGVKYLEDVQSDRRAAERLNQNFALVFEENVLRSIGELDKALLYVRHSIETRQDTTDLSTIVRTTDVLSEIILQIAVVDAHGITRASNVGPQPAPSVDLSDRDHFRFHLNNPHDELYISKPVIGRVSGVVREWRSRFEALDVSPKQCDRVASAFRHPRDVGFT